MPGFRRNVGNRLLSLAPQEFKIQNIVGSCDVKFPIFLEGLAWSHSMFASVRMTLPAPPSVRSFSLAC